MMPPSTAVIATSSASSRSGAVLALAAHWPEYLMEAAGLGVFMISACAFGVVYEYPGSPVRQALSSPEIRRLLMGLSMGLTAVGIIYSAWGKQSGAHINPATTLTFLRLGKIRGWDALFYSAAQFIGGIIGVGIAAFCASHQLSSPSVNFVATKPGARGAVAAAIAEFLMTFGLMSTVLKVMSVPKLARYTGLFVGATVATYITLEAPISGMSMNPARTFASAVFAGDLRSLFIYFIFPPLGMLAAAELHLRRNPNAAKGCAKLHHDNPKRCIFCGANGGSAA